MIVQPITIIIIETLTLLGLDIDSIHPTKYRHMYST
jgi:hypothetical protein